MSSYYFVYFSEYDMEKEHILKEWIKSHGIGFYSISAGGRIMYICSDEETLSQLKNSYNWIYRISKDTGSSLLVTDEF